MKEKSFIFRILSVFLLISFLSIFAFEAEHAGHSCEKDDCPVCILLSIIRVQLNSFIQFGDGEEFKADKFFIYFLPLFFTASIPCISLVWQKVRLND